MYLSIENPNYVDTYDLMETLDNMTVEEYLQEMEDYGYDGLIVTDQEFDNATSYVAFKPNQIKSATDNVGMFADICYFVSLRCNGLQAASQALCPAPTAAEQSGDRQRREKGPPILSAEKGEHERAPNVSDSYPTPLRATLRAPPTKWAIKAFFRRVSAASRGRGQPRRGYRRPKPATKGGRRPTSARNGRRP